MTLPHRIARQKPLAIDTALTTNPVAHAGERFCEGSPMSIHDFTRTAGMRLSMLALGAALAACGGSHDKGATQAAAKVNSGEITVHQINQVLEQQPGLRPEQVEATSRRVLERLIDQELAIQQAVEQKLDREPRVVAAIEAARRDIIARAYIDKISGQPTPATPAEVQAYFDSHAGLFSNRKVYQLQEVTIEADASQQAEVMAQLKAAKGPAEFTEWLKSQPLRFNSAQTTQPAENLPIDLVEQISKVADGHVVAMPQPPGLKLIFVIAAKPAPLTLEQSKPAIEKFIVNDRKRVAVQDEIKRLRAAGKIEYLGKFAGTAASAAAAEPAAPAASATAPTATAPATPAAASKPTGMDDATLKKGLGLK